MQIFRQNALKCFSLTIVLLAFSNSGCREAAEESARPNNQSSLIEKAQQFRSFVAAEQHDKAREMMADNPRRWFEQREGEGRPWTIGPGKQGPWAAWDQHFRTRKQEIEWKSMDNHAILTQRETNDYFQMLERGWVTNEISYFFDASGKIAGLLIRAIGQRPPGRTDEFLAWARQNAPDELAVLMPNGDIDPGGDHPARFHALLQRWRAEAGLSAME